MTAATRTFASFDGAPIAYRVLGEGRPTLMLHGFLADAARNFVAPGIAAAIVQIGRQAILPDLRGHGGSAAPSDPAAYPPDVLALDQESLIAHLGLTDFDLVGYSLGARTSVRLMARGSQPGKAVLGGMGDSGITNVARRQAHFTDLLRGPDESKDPPAARVVAAMLAQGGMRRDAALNVLASQRSTPPETLGAIETPILVISGAQDEDNGSADALAALLPHARAERVPGNHLSAVAAPELTHAIVRFLA